MICESFIGEIWTKELKVLSLNNRRKLDIKNNQQIKTKFDNKEEIILRKPDRSIHEMDS